MSLQVSAMSLLLILSIFSAARTVSCTSGGVTYVRWGRLGCEDNGATLLYRGYMTSHHHSHGGGGSNILCLPETPQWRNHTASTPASGWLFGTAFFLDGDHASFFSTVNTGGRSLHRTPVPCAVCYVSQRSASVMIPAAIGCPVGWTQEYGGYLMSEHSYDDINQRPRHPTTYICVDQAPEIARGVSSGQLWLVLVKVGCGTLPCSHFPNGWELACAVCTK